MINTLEVRDIMSDMKMGNSLMDMYWGSIYGDFIQSRLDTLDALLLEKSGKRYSQFNMQDIEEAYRGEYGQ